MQPWWAYKKLLLKTTPYLFLINSFLFVCCFLEDALEKAKKKKKSLSLKFNVKMLLISLLHKLSPCSLDLGVAVSIQKSITSFDLSDACVMFICKCLPLWFDRFIWTSPSIKTVMISLLHTSILLRMKCRSWIQNVVTRCHTLDDLCV